MNSSVASVRANSSPLLDRALVTAFLENVPDNVYFKDRASRFIAVSASFVRYFKCADESEVVGKTDFEFFSADHARPAFADEQRIMRTGEPMLGKLEKEVWPDGTVKWVLSSKLPLRDETGEIIGTFGISQDVTESKEMEIALEQTRKELMEASRRAGMTEVATGVLHNVGNVLNSLNVSASIVASGLRHSKLENLGKLSSLFAEHRADLGRFVTEDPKGKLVPEYLVSLAAHAEAERAQLLQEVESLQKNIDHIKEIVSTQQAYATTIGFMETLDAVTLMEDSLRMNSAALFRHDVRVAREYQDVPLVQAEKCKVLQILVNLIRNAKYAADEGGSNNKLITVRIEPGEPDRVRFVVADNGIGIPPENIERIFSHGFTTRPEGHGFGLHSSAMAARDMHGTLTAFSEGLGKGATFVLDLPAAPPDAVPSYSSRET